MAHPRSRDTLEQTWIPNAGAQFKQNPRGVVKKVYWAIITYLTPTSN
jgi:hypothetical protein